MSSTKTIVDNVNILGNTQLSNLDISGTVNSGTWNGDTMTVPFGGTGATTFVVNELLVGNGTSSLQSTTNLSYSANLLTVPSVSSTSTISSTSPSTGSIVAIGGIGINNSTNATSSSNGGALTVLGGGGFGGDVYIGGSLNATNLTLSSGIDATTLTLTDTTASTSSTVGSFVTSGGISSSNIANSVNNANGGGLTIAGGAAIAKRLITGSDFTDIPDAANGNILSISTLEYTDSATAIAGTLSNWKNTFIGQTTISALNNGVTTTEASSLYIEGEPIAGTNQSITTSYALHINSGTSNFNGNILGTTSTFTGVQTNTDSTASTSITTGALVLSGGLGINNTTDAVDSTNGGTFSTDGGAAIRKSLYVGDLCSSLRNSITGTTASTSTTTGILLVSGGIASSLATNAVSSTNGGGITIAGGMAVGLDAYFGGNVSADRITLPQIATPAVPPASNKTLYVNTSNELRARDPAGGDDDLYVANFGESFGFIQDNALSTTTSTTFVDKINVTSPAYRVGTYRYMAFAVVEKNANNRETRARLLVDGVIPKTGAAFPAQRWRSQANGNSSVFIEVGILTFATVTTHTFQLQFSSNNTDHTAEIGNAYIELFRVS